MKRITAFFVRFWPIIVLFAVEIVLFIANYTPRTFVLGWDNMYPELNFALNIKRALFGIWQEYRGLGLEDGLSHASQLPHYIFLWLLSFVLPQNLLRYAFIFLTHLTGGIGMYFLLRDYIFKASHSQAAKATALAGALFYQFNFAIVQMFYLPFEVFMVHFAALPWLMLTTLQYLENGSKKYLLFFAAVSLASTVQAHVPTVFLVYCGVLALTLFVYILTERSMITLRRAVIIILVTIFVNAYWGLPFTHATLSHVADIAQSKNNVMATDDIFAKNQKYGNLTDTALMRNFSLDYVQYDYTTGMQGNMFDQWKKHSFSPVTEAIAGVFFTLALIGAILALVKRQRRAYPFVALFVFSFFIIGNDIPVISLFSQTLRTAIPFFQNVFRFVFTKFFTVYAFAYSVLIALTICEIIHAATHAIKKDTIIIVSIFVVILGWYTYPSFTGNFLYKNLRVAIPKEYTDTISFFRSEDPTKRILILPAPWFWAWTQYRWSVITSGFLWFGIPQPIVDRAFDPWSNTDENLYWELSQAIYTKDARRLDAILSKYDIGWVLMDKNIINASYERALYTNDIISMLSSLKPVTLTQTFGKISLYQYSKNTAQTSFVSILTDLPTVSPTYKWNDNDVAYGELGDYVSTDTAGSTVYPFRSLFTGRSTGDQEFSIVEDATTITFAAPHEATKASVIKSTNVVYEGTASSDFKQPARSCDGYNTGIFSRTPYVENNRSYQRFTSVGSSNCLTLHLPTLTQRSGYLVAVTYRNIKGKPLSVSIVNSDTRRAFLETQLESKANGIDTVFKTSYLVIPPMDPYGLGYTLTFDNVAIGKNKTINDLSGVQVYTIPYEKIVDMKTINGSLSIVGSKTASFSGQLTVTYPNPAYYRVSIAPNTSEALNDATLVLSQSFDNGWIALGPTKTFPFIKPIGNHVLVNNWENGWQLSSKQTTNTQLTIILFYWPQILEWIGFVILPIPFLVLLVKKH